MRILAIETSCDETAIALLEIRNKKNHREVSILGNALLSQTSLHALLGGVVPMLAKREHANNLIPMLTVALTDAKVLQQRIFPKKFSAKTNKKLKEIFTHEPELYEAFVEFIPTLEKPKIDKIAVTAGPGLEPALWVGINFAQALSLIWEKPVVPINHMEGHILSSVLTKKEEKEYILEKPKFPILALLISGGHTELVLAKKFGAYKIIGETRDDAVGEAFDKVARMLGLPYPGGPQISKLAEEAREKSIVSKHPLPRPMMKTFDFDFSFAGLKTAVLYTLKKISGGKSYDISYETKLMLAREFEDAATDVLLKKVERALKKTKAKTLAVGGGVIANKNIRKELSKLVEIEFPAIKLFLPTPNLTTDNAIMIGLASSLRGKSTKKKIKADGNLRLD